MIVNKNKNQKANIDVDYIQKITLPEAGRGIGNLWKWHFVATAGPLVCKKGEIKRVISLYKAD